MDRLRRWGSERGVDAPVLESAVVSVEGSARRGVPVEMAERLVREAAERGVPARGIEAITRALAYGAGRGALLSNLESFARESLKAGAAADVIALGLYRLAAPAALSPCADRGARYTVVAVSPRGAVRRPRQEESS